jgi:hypothetical protein
MPGKFHHEQLYRGDVFARLAATRITLCGSASRLTGRQPARQGFGA